MEASIVIMIQINKNLHIIKTVWIFISLFV